MFSFVSVGVLSKQENVTPNKTWARPATPIANALSVSLPNVLHFCKTDGQASLIHIKVPLAVFTAPFWTRSGCDNLLKQNKQVCDVLYSDVMHTEE